MGITADESAELERKLDRDEEREPRRYRQQPARHARLIQSARFADLLTTKRSA